MFNIFKKICFFIKIEDLKIFPFCVKILGNKNDQAICFLKKKNKEQFSLPVIVDQGKVEKKKGKLSLSFYLSYLLL